MIQIRHNIFETNSSSSHSLVFSNKDRGYSFDLPVDENGVLTIPFGEYGWGPEILKTPLEKLSYLITSWAGGNWNDDKKSWEDLVQETLERTEKILDLVKFTCPQVKKIQFEKASDFYPRGYIDHESYGIANEVEPYELIFNNKIIVLIDNDNTCYFSDYDYDNKQEELFDRDIENLRLER